MRRRLVMLALFVALASLLLFVAWREDAVPSTPPPTATPYFQHPTVPVIPIAR